MNGTIPQPRSSGADPLVRMARKVRRIVAEMNRAQRLMTIRRMAVDPHLNAPDTPPQTYAEFLARTHAPMLREPSADDRAAGRLVR